MADSLKGGKLFMIPYRECVVQFVELRQNIYH